VKPDLPSEGEVELWWADLRRQSPKECLSQEEMARGARFANSDLQRRFLNGRALLRRILASYLDLEPAVLQFRTGRFGKPALAGQRGWSFNVSHSREWFVCAVSTHRRLGVDIEARRELNDAPAIAARFFSPNEVLSLGDLSGADGQTAFFSCWTRKEALIKATGWGLTLPLDSFDVAAGREEVNCLLGTRIPSLQRRAWHIVDASRDGSPPCAIAADGPIHGVRHRECAAD
jgi:4'-phosphopantetheinyl transferase